MPRRPSIPTFKIDRKDARAYRSSPVKSHRRNGGVTAIAAVNGPGAYARRGRGKSARELLEEVAPSGRRRVARSATRSAIAEPPVRRRRTGTTQEGEETMITARSRRRRTRRNAASSALVTRASRAASKAKRHSVSSAVAPAKPKRKAAKKSTTKAKGKRTAAERRASARKAARTRKANALAAVTPKRSAPKRKAAKRRSANGKRKSSLTKEQRSAAAKKGWRTRRMTKAKRSALTGKSSARGVRRTVGKSMRKNARRGVRKMRRNAGLYGRRRGSAGTYGRSPMRTRRNASPLMRTIKTGAWIAGGFAAHKGLSKILSDYVVAKVLGAPTAAQPIPAAAAVSGLEGLAPYKGLISNLLVAAVGIPLTLRTKQLTQEQRNAVAGGMATSLVHGLLVNLLEATGNAQAATFLSGSDGTAARLSAMMGLGTDVPKVSLEPMYAPISGLGQIQQAAAGMGNMGILQAAAGMGAMQTGPGFAYQDGSLGEYFESGVAGLGNYTSNPNIMQAAAGYSGMGTQEHNTNHIDPMVSDLDTELSIAEAAAGVGEYFESGVSGVGEYFESGVSGLGAVSDVPRSSTWIPGESNPQLWAATRGITRSQESTAMTPGGTLQSGGGAGIFG